MSRTALRMRVIPRIPAKIVGTTGVKVVVDGLDYVVSSDTPTLTAVPTVSNLGTSFVQLYNADNDSYGKFSIQNLVDTVEIAIADLVVTDYGPTISIGALQIKDAVMVLRTNGYYVAGDNGGWTYRRKALTETDEPGQITSNAGTVRWGLIGTAVSALAFGCKGDGASDDAPSMLVAFNWFKQYSNLTLFFPGNYSYRMASAVLCDLSGVAAVGNVIFEGAIKPDAGIGRAITIRNSRGGEFTCRVNGGGQTADYSQANPAGADEAFAFVNAYRSILHCVEGRNYQGRVLRITSETANIGPDGFKTQWLDIRKVSWDSTAAITDAEATRLAQGVGQSFYIDSGTNAFGTMVRAFGQWELYGPVVENTTDLTLIDMETGWRANSGLELRGVISFWGGILKIGSEKGVGSPDLLRIIPSTVTTDGAVARAPQNIEIQHIFAVGGTNNVVITDVGTVAGQGIVIHSLNSRTSVTAGLVLNNVRKGKIGMESYADNIALITTSSTQRIDFTRFSSDASKLQTMVIGTGAAGINFFGGGAYNGNQNAVASIALCEINTVGRINFFGFEFSSANVDFLLKLVASNGIRIFGGAVSATGGSAILSGQPNRADNVTGLITAARGQLSQSTGTTSFTIAHGLVKVPAWWDARGNTAEAATPRVTADATNLTVTFPAALTASTLVVWKAEIDYAGT